jgi:hypothetical protein
MADMCGELLYGALPGINDKSTELALQRSIIACALQAKDCTALMACVKATPDQQAACASAGGHNTCVGQVLVECTSGPGTPDAFDCGKAGLVCGAGGSDGECGRAACDPAQKSQWCEGDLRVSCDDAKVEQVRDCRYSSEHHCAAEADGGFQCKPAYGGTCALIDGVASCVGTGAACDEKTYEPRCDGSTLVSCRGGKESRYDCKMFDASLSCGLSYNDMLGCVMGTECQLESPETCEDGKVGFCIAGKKFEVDCKALGLSGCTTAAKDQSVVARCVQ